MSRHQVRAKAFCPLDSCQDTQGLGSHLSSCRPRRSERHAFLGEENAHPSSIGARLEIIEFHRVSCSPPVSEGNGQPLEPTSQSGSSAQTHCGRSPLSAAISENR